MTRHIRYNNPKNHEVYNCGEIRHYELSLIQNFD